MPFALSVRLFHICLSRVFTANYYQGFFFGLSSTAKNTPAKVFNILKGVSHLKTFDDKKEVNTEESLYQS